MCEHERDTARARGERIHLIWSQLAAHAYRNGQWGREGGERLPPLSCSLSLSPSLACSLARRASPLRHEPGAGRSDGQA